MSSEAISAGVAGRPMPKVAGSFGAACAGAVVLVCATSVTAARVPARPAMPMLHTAAMRTMRSFLMTMAPRGTPRRRRIERATP